MEATKNFSKSTEFKGEESKNEFSIVLDRESCVTMDACVTVEKSTASKGVEESKNENTNSGSVDKKEAAVVDSGHSKIAITAATAESSSQKKNKKKKNYGNRILVSHTKKPFVFYLNLAKV